MKCFTILIIFLVIEASCTVKNPETAANITNAAENKTVKQQTVSTPDIRGPDGAGV